MLINVNICSQFYLFQNTPRRVDATSFQKIDVDKPSTHGDFCFMENEIWKSISGYEGLYSISNFGNLKSHFRTKKSSWNGIQIVPEKLMKLCSDKDGYCTASINKQGKGKPVKIHRLVALAFIPNKENKPQVNHIDGNKRNNYYKNLEWCTNSENQLHALRIGLKDPKKHIPKVQRKVIQLTINGEFIKVWDSIKYAADFLGINSNGIISVCRKTKSKTAAGYKWEYYNDERMIENGLL